MGDAVHKGKCGVEHQQNKLLSGQPGPRGSVYLIKDPTAVLTSDRGWSTSSHRRKGQSKMLKKKMGKAASNWKNLWEERRGEEEEETMTDDQEPQMERCPELSNQTGPADRFLQQSSDDSSALQTSVVPSATERGLFVSLIWCPPGSSRAGEDNWGGGQPPPQIPIEFIHLCFPKWAHPHISAHNSDAFMRDTGVYHVTARQYDMNQLLSYQIWCSWFRNSCSIPYLSVPSLWHGELQDTQMLCCEAVFHRHPETFVIVENWNQLCKD